MKLFKNTLLFSTLLTFLFINTNLSFAANDVATSTRHPVKTIHESMNQVLPLSKIWELISKDSSTTPEWWGIRGDLEEKGISMNFVYTADIVTNTGSGIKPGSALLGNLDLTLSADTEKLGWWDNGTFFIYGLYSHGSNRPTEKLIGDLQGVSNIDSARIFRLYELWYQHTLADDKLSLLAGLHDLNADFSTTEYGGLFLNSSFGLAPSMSANTSVSTLPLTSPAAQIKWSPNEMFDFLGGVFVGDPGDDETNEHGTNIAFNKKRGAMSIFETNIHINPHCPIRDEDYPGTFKIGAWHNNRDLDDVLAVDDNGDTERHDDNFGYYVILDQLLYRESSESDQGLGVFVQYGAAPDDRNTVDAYYGIGFNYKGLIPGRDNDNFGFAVAHASISEELRQAEERNRAEETFELTYRIQATDSIAIQPDFQYINNPGATPDINNAFVAITRFEISF